MGRVRYYSIPLRLISEALSTDGTETEETPKTFETPVETAGKGVACTHTSDSPGKATGNNPGGNNTTDTSKKGMEEFLQEAVFSRRVRSVYFGFLLALALVTIFHCCTRRASVRYEPLQSSV